MKCSGVYYILEGEEDFILRGRSVARCTAAGGEIYVPYGVTTLYYTFSGCGPDTVIHIPESVTAAEIDTVSFNRHFSLAYLPSGITSFKSYRKSDGCYVCPANSVTEQTLLDAGCTYRLKEYPDWLIDRVVLEDGTSVRRALSYLGEEEDVYLPEGVQYVSSSLIGRGSVIRHIHIGSDIRTDNASFTISPSWTALEEFRVPLGASSVTLGYGSISDLRYVEIPEGVARLSGTLNSSADCVFVLPSTLVEISGNLTYGHVTFYCFRDSYADAYGREKGYTVLYLDDTALQRVLGPEVLHGDINTSVDLGKVLTRIPASPAETFDIVVDDPTVARVDENRLMFLALGETTLHVKANAAAEDVLDITVQSWLPVEEFVIPTIYNMDGYRRVYTFKPVITKPETGGNPYFSWRLNGENLSSLPSCSSSSKEFRVLGAADLTVTATSASGVTATGRLDFSSRAETIIIDCETDHHFLLGDLFSFPWDKITFVIDGDAKSAGQLIADGALEVGMNGDGVLRMLSADRCQAVRPGTAEIALKKMTLPPQSGSTPAQYEDLLTLTLTVSEGSALVIPEGIEQIDEEAFSGICVRRIILPDSLSAIGSRAFADCGDLRVIELSSLTDLD